MIIIINITTTTTTNHNYNNDNTNNNNDTANSKGRQQEGGDPHAAGAGQHAEEAGHVRCPRRKRREARCSAT